MLNSHPNIIDKGEFVGQSITNYNLKWRNIWFRDVFWPQYLG